MLLRDLPLLFDSPLLFVQSLLLWLVTVGLGLLTGIAAHEFSHALIARQLGDPTAERLGRVSLNPVRHLDPMGTLMLLIVGFGWGKPVPVNVYALRNGRAGYAMVAAAGPLSNLVAAALLSLPFRFGVLEMQPSFSSFSALDPVSLVSIILEAVLTINVLLCVFNLLPLPPLDGSNVLLGILPESLAKAYMPIVRLGPVILIIVIAIDFMTGAGILSRVMGPPIDFLLRLLLP